MKTAIIKLLAGILENKDTRHNVSVFILSILVGIIVLLMMPAAAIYSLSQLGEADIDLSFDESEYIDSLSDEEREAIERMKSDSLNIIDAMTEIGYREYIIKAQLIYFTFFENNSEFDFYSFAEHFSENDNEILIANINSDYGLNVPFDEFQQSYVMIMNSTINVYMFKNPEEKNSIDAAAWCRNAVISKWHYQDGYFGEMNETLQSRCADNVGLILGYLRYDTNTNLFSNEADILIYSVIGDINSMPDIQGIGVFDGSEFGVYIGDGEVVSSSAISGEIEISNIYDDRWTNWCIFEGISYPQEVFDCIEDLQNSPEENMEEKEGESE